MTKKVIGIIGAMQEEIEEYTKHMTGLKKENWNEFIFYKGKLFDKGVVVVKSGIGKVFSAMICQKLITSYNPSRVIFTGVAGALNKKLKIGDVVIAEKCIQHDIEAEALGFKRGTIPYTEHFEFKADKELVKSALTADLDNHSVMIGTVLTGDQFLTKEHIDEMPYLGNELNGDAVEMEGAAIAQVCTVNKIPFLVVRTISDNADHSAAIDFNKFLPVVAKNSFQIVKAVLEKKQF